MRMLKKLILSLAVAGCLFAAAPGACDQTTKTGTKYENPGGLLSDFGLFTPGK